MSSSTDTPVTSEEMVFHGYLCFETSTEVWAVLHAKHQRQLRAFSSFSDPDGTCLGYGDGSIGKMETTYGLRGADIPLIGCRTTWDIEKDQSRQNIKHEYFIVIAMEKRT